MDNKSIEIRFKILALLVINMNLPFLYQNKIDILARAIDRNSIYKLKFLMIVEKQVLEFIEQSTVSY